MDEVQVAPRDPSALEHVARPEQYAEFAQRMAEMRGHLGDHIVWNINSTASGGGVAEMLHVLLPYVRGADIDARWLVLAGEPDFFRLTKRLHHALHGAPGDRGPLAEEQHDLYREVSARNVEVLATGVRPGDIVIAHDPQTVGLLPALNELGAHTIWRCHIGAEAPNERSELGWEFLHEYLPSADAYVFTRESYIPPRLDRDRVALIPPSIDPLSPKNADLDEDEVETILATIGVRDGGDAGEAVYFRGDGTRSHVRREARAVRTCGPLPAGTGYVTQVSRWDPLKDMEGVMDGFARALDVLPDVHLLLVGPDVTGVTDDPEGREVLDRCAGRWDELPEAAQARTHLICLPMADSEENAVMVNAIQRGADVVIQKSIAEGFGLTVAEAMWKARPVVASSRGGIRDQIVSGEHGVLLDDPSDLDSFADALAGILGDADRVERLGRAARERIRDAFLPTRHLLQWGDVIEAVTEGEPVGAAARA